MADPNMREVALECLLEILERGSYSHQVLQQVLTKYQYLPKQQRAFCSRLVQGTVERTLTLDYVIDCHAKMSVSKMRPVIRTILRSGAYQILYMEQIPDSAACNEAVKLAKKRGFARLGGFVNGVLRSISRNKENIRYPNWEAEYAMPQWIIDRWLRTYQAAEVEGMLSSFLMEEATCIRVNLARTTPEALREELEACGVTVTPSGRIPYAMYISHYDHLESLRAFTEGLFYVQNISSMLAVEAAGICPGQYVLDVCGAPGGKALHAAEKLAAGGEGKSAGEDGRVEVRDLTEAKVSLIRENIARSRLHHLETAVMDAAVLHEPSVGTADVVIADLPCSGLGVIGRKPDIKYHLTPERIAELVSLQRRILAVVQAYVKPRGTLLYSTCTVSVEENQENVDWFLREHPAFGCTQMCQLLPEQGRQDGFFWAVLRRK